MAENPYQSPEAPTDPPTKKRRRIGCLHIFFAVLFLLIVYMYVLEYFLVPRMFGRGQ
jgi:hypothetical protein